MLRPHEVPPQRGQCVDLNLTDVAHEPGPLCGLLIPPAEVVREAIILLVKEVDGFLMEVGVIADPPDFHNPGTVHNPLNTVHGPSPSCLSGLLRFILRVCNAIAIAIKDLEVIS